jgi:hypothetical protein
MPDHSLCASVIVNYYACIYLIERQEPIMDIAPQLLILGGVALGALASYLTSSLTDRTRHQRDLSGRWEGRKFDTYASYISDVKQQGAVANQISASRGLNTRVTSPLIPEEGMGRLADAALRRSLSSERATLLADADTLLAIRALNDAVWLLECYACGTVDGANTENWEVAFTAYRACLDSFHRCARTELGTPGHLVGRSPELYPSKPMGGILDASKPKHG